MILDLMNWHGRDGYRMCVGSKFIHKGKEITLKARSRGKWPLNNLQVQHLKGELDLYKPIEAFSMRYDTKSDKNKQYVSASPSESTRRRNDLPPIYMQWKEDYRKRYVGQ